MFVYQSWSILKYCYFLCCVDVWCILMLNKCRKIVKNCQVIDIYSAIVAVGFWSSAVCQGHWLPWTYHRVWHSLEFLLHTCHCQSEFTCVHSKIRWLDETCWVSIVYVAFSSCLLADALHRCTVAHFSSSWGPYYLLFTIVLYFARVSNWNSYKISMLQVILYFLYHIKTCSYWMLSRVINILGNTQRVQTPTKDCQNWTKWKR